MTDRDNPPEGFLERWSRKKTDAERDAPDRSPEKDVVPADDSDSPEHHADATVSPKASPPAEFDLASLPSLDSITAATDVRAFLSPGVPKELARAALRRAWLADPAIRNFKGLAEYDWDFTDPNAMVGFGPLEPGYDIQKLVAQIFSDGEKAEAPDAEPREPAGQQEAHMTEVSAVPEPPADPQPLTENEQECLPPGRSPLADQVADAGIVQRNNNTAPHNSNGDQEPEVRKNRRQHGGALPQ